MPTHLVENVIKKIKDLWAVSSNLEITLEANPTSVEREKFCDLALAGINRISLGIQSLKEEDLKFLGRTHSVSEARKAIEIAKNYFPRYSLDFIYTLPHQTLKDWENQLEQALSLANGHLSLYQLTIEEGTPFFLSFQKRDFSLPSNDESALFYERTQEITKAYGYDAYEISNYAILGQECRHNMTYWKYHDYIGIGPGAHSRITFEGEKYGLRRHRSPEKWMEDVFSKKEGTHEIAIIPWKRKYEEFFMMGLRLQQGISLEEFSQQMGRPLSQVVNKEKLESLIKEDLLDLSKLSIKATQEGRQRLDSILKYLFE